MSKEFAPMTEPPRYKFRQDWSKEFTYAKMLPDNEACHILRNREVFAFTEGEENAKLICDALNEWLR